MAEKSVETRGRTLDYAASVYDFCEPLFMFGRQSAYNRSIVTELGIEKHHKILDLGCGTGVLTRMIADQLDPELKGLAIGIDAAARMISVARKKRSSSTCRFEIAAAEELPFEDKYFDGVVSSLFFHHVPLDLKERALREAYRVLVPGGRLVIADMHTPTGIPGVLISYLARFLLFQPEIAENYHGVLPQLMVKAGFLEPRLVGTHFGYIATFSTNKEASADP